MKAHINYITLTMLVSIIAIIIASIIRGHFAIGGEWFLWIIPAVIAVEKEFPIDER